MTALRVLLSRALDIVLGRRRHERLADEIQEHLDLLTDEYVARGMTPRDARYAARRAFGGVDQVKAVYRDQQGLPFLDALTEDLRFAFRLLSRDRGFATTVVLVLGLGIGINNMLFTILNAHTLRGLPLDEVDRIVFMSTFDDRAPDRGVSYLDFLDWRDRAGAFSAMAAFTSAPVIVAEDGRSPDRFDGTFVSGHAFAMIGVQPVLGRDFTPADDRPGAAAVVILGNGAWESRYGGDRDVLGRSILVNGTPATIIGVLRDRSGFPTTAQIWLPLSHLPGIAAHTRDTRPLRVLGRLRDGPAVSEARAEIETIADQLSREHPATNKNVRARVVPINEQLLGSATHPAWFAFMGAGCLVILISCANAANLMLARHVHRAREIAIRTALGASRRRVIRQLLVEGSVLATLGGLLGLAFAVGGVQVFRTAIPENVLPYWIDYSPDARVMVALVAVSAAAVFVFALLPAIHTSRSDVNAVLKDAERTGTGRGGRGWTTAFLAAEFGLAVVFLALFVVNVRTALPALPTDLVIDTRDVLTATIALPAEAYGTLDERHAFYGRLRERLGALPAVSSMAVAGTLPLFGAEEGRLDVEGRPRGDTESGPAVRTVPVGPRYFETLGLTLIRGRDFTEADGGPGQAHVIVNERLVQQFFSETDPIGQRIAVGPTEGSADPQAWLTIVGVAPSIRQRPAPTPDPLVYLPIRATPPATAILMVRSPMEAAALVPLLRDEVAALDRNLPLYRTRTMAQVVNDAQWNGRLSTRLFFFLTFIAVALSTVGLYAVTAHSVSQRTREIGVRMAFGAQPRHVMRLIARRVALQLAVGFLTGIVLTKLWESTFPSGRADVTATDPQSLLAVAALVTIVALVACVVPARRAMRLDPVAAIKRE